LAEVLNIPKPQKASEAHSGAFCGFSFIFYAPSGVFRPGTAALFSAFTASLGKVWYTFHLE
jgi:hypothetical protein